MKNVKFPEKRENLFFPVFSLFFLQCFFLQNRSGKKYIQKKLKIYENKQFFSLYERGEKRSKVTKHFF